MVHLVFSSSLPTPYRCLMFSPSSSPLSCNLCHHGLLTCKSCNMNSYALYCILASLDSDMDHAPMSYISHTIFLLMEKGLVVLFPCTTRMLGIHSCGVLLSYMWYTKQLLFCPYSCSGLIEMLYSSGPP
jgi:hypothetical protein